MRFGPEIFLNPSPRPHPYPPPFLSPLFFLSRFGGIFPLKRPVPSLLRIGSVSVQLGEGHEENLMDYSLPKVAPTMATVEEVMQLFESGGKVTYLYPFSFWLLGGFVDVREHDLPNSYSYFFILFCNLYLSKKKLRRFSK